MFATMTWILLTSMVIVGSAFVLIALERRIPYDSRQRLLLKGLIKDLVFYGLQYIMNGPEMHRWHHAVEIIDVSFSTKLAIWDWFFGTAYHPNQEPRGYGLAKGNFPSGYFRQVLYAFRIPGRSRPDTEAGRATSPL